MSLLGQYAKSSLRADVFRFAPNIGRYSVAAWTTLLPARRIPPLSSCHCHNAVNGGGPELGRRAQRHIAPIFQAKK
jgi:hypothetical protein